MATVMRADEQLGHGRGDQGGQAMRPEGVQQAGQVCISVQRILVQEDVVEEFSRLLVAETGKFKLGNSLDVNTDIGPMIAEKEAARVEDWFAEAVGQGARVAYGGMRDGPRSPSK